MFFNFVNKILLLYFKFQLLALVILTILHCAYEKKQLYPAKKSSAQVGVRVNSDLIRNDYIKVYISLFREIILQQLDTFQTEIQGSFTKLCAFKASRGHPSKVVKLPTMLSGAENMEYLNNP